MDYNRTCFLFSVFISFILALPSTIASESSGASLGVWLSPHQRTESIRIDLLLPPRSQAVDGWRLIKLGDSHFETEGFLADHATVSNLVVQSKDKSSRVLLFTTSNRVPVEIRSAVFESNLNQPSDWIRSTLSAVLGAGLALIGFLIQETIVRKRQKLLSFLDSLWILQIFADATKKEINNNKHPEVPNWISNPESAGWRPEFIREPLVTPIKNLRDALYNYSLHKDSSSKQAVIDVADEIVTMTKARIKEIEDAAI